MELLVLACLEVFLMALLNVITVNAVYAQAVESGLGNSTVIESGTQLDPYGISGSNSAVAGDVMATRHRPTGQGSGIGGSFMGTTSVTSETRPVGQAAIVEPVRTPMLVNTRELSETKKRLFSQRMLATPAVSNPPNLPSFSAMTAADITGQQIGVPTEQPDLSLLMNQVSKRYELNLNQPMQLWNNMQQWDDQK